MSIMAVLDFEQAPARMVAKLTATRVVTPGQPSPATTQPVTPAAGNQVSGWARLADAYNMAIWAIANSAGLPAALRSQIKSAYAAAGGLPDLKANPITDVAGWQRLKEIRKKVFWDAWHKLPPALKERAKAILLDFTLNSPDGPGPLGAMSGDAWKAHRAKMPSVRVAEGAAAPAGGGGGGGGGGGAGGIGGWARLADAYNMAFWAIANSAGLPAALRNQVRAAYQASGATPDLKTITTLDGWKQLKEIRKKQFWAAWHKLPSAALKERAKAILLDFTLNSPDGPGPLGAMSGDAWKAHRGKMPTVRVAPGALAGFEGGPGSFDCRRDRYGQCVTPESAEYAEAGATGLYSDPITGEPTGMGPAALRASLTRGEVVSRDPDASLQRAFRPNTFQRSGIEPRTRGTFQRSAFEPGPRGTFQRSSALAPRFSTIATINPNAAATSITPGFTTMGGWDDAAWMHGGAYGAGASSAYTAGGGNDGGMNGYDNSLAGWGFSFTKLFKQPTTAGIKGMDDFLRRNKESLGKYAPIAGAVAGAIPGWGIVAGPAVYAAMKGMSAQGQMEALKAAEKRAAKEGGGIGDYLGDVIEQMGVQIPEAGSSQGMADMLSQVRGLLESVGILDKRPDPHGPIGPPVEAPRALPRAMPVGVPYGPSPDPRDYGRGGFDWKEALPLAAAGAGLLFFATQLSGGRRR